MIDIAAVKLYRIEEELRQNIINNTWRPNEIIPTEMDLCDMYEVSRTTIRNALQRLVDDGLLFRVRGKGTIVSAHNDINYSPHEGLRKKIWSAIGNISPQKISFEYCPASAGVAKRLHILPDETVLRIERECEKKSVKVK